MKQYLMKDAHDNQTCSSIGLLDLPTLLVGRFEMFSSCCLMCL